MMRSTEWRNNKWFILQVSFFVACCIVALWIHRLVEADTLGDTAAVALQFGMLAAIVGAGVIALTAAFRARNPIERIVRHVLAIGFLLVGTTFVKASYADVSVALHSLAETTDDSKTIVALGPTGDDVRLSGDLTEGANRALTDLLAVHPEVKRIHLTSSGGLVDEGEALRKTIAAHKLTTFVPDYCVSACTLAFAGGRERLIMEGGRLGFHAPFEEGLFDQTFAGDNSAERASYIAAGLAPDFVDQAFEVKPDDIWTPEPDRLLSAHVITGVVDRFRFPDSNLDGNATEAGARATVLRNFPLARALDEWRPQAIDVIAAWYVEAYTKGQSEGRITDDLTSIIGGAASLAIRQADDDTLVGVGRFVDAAMEAAETEEECAAIGANASLIQAEAILNEEGESGNGDKLAFALLSKALRPHHSRLALGHARMDMWPEATMIALAGAQGPCAQMRGLYAHALSLPQHGAAALIRTIITQPRQQSPVALAAVGIASN